ncbi:MAG TPA: hypothetical protein VJ715_11200 [Pyrinomonadaceae bacterium]|nr:hypothetical protein [Pyrinomonadaceae bacterium]
MQRRRATALLIAALLAVATASCGGKKAATPTEVFKAFYEAALAADVATLKNLLSKETLVYMEGQAKSKNQSLDDYLAAQSRSFPPGLPEVGEEKIEGAKATLKFKHETNRNWSTARFVKDDDEWKIDLR